MSILIAKKKSTDLGNECKLLLENMHILIDQFPEMESAYTEGSFLLKDKSLSFEELEKEVDQILMEIENNSEETEIRNKLATLREIYDIIEESEIVKKAGEEYLSKFDLYQMAEQDSSLLDQEIKKVEDEKSEQDKEIEDLKLKIKELIESNEQVESQIEAMNNEVNDSAENNISDQKKKIEELQIQISKATEDINSKELELRNLNMELDQKKKEKESG